MKREDVKREDVRRAIRERVLLLAVVLLALALRVHRLDSQSLWYDEAVTAQVAGQGIAQLTRWTADDIQPPLYYYVVAGWSRLAGRSEWALRFPSACAGALTVALLWAAAARLFGRGARGRAAGLAAALLAALSPLWVYYSQEARMYGQLTFLGLLVGYALLRAASTATPRAAAACWAAFAAVTVAMLYTHYFGLFLLAAYVVCLLAAWLVAGAGKRAATQGRPHGGVGLVLSLLVIGLAYLPWLPAMLERYAIDRSYWRGALKLGEALRHLGINLATGAPETMLEADAVRLLPWFGAALVISVVALAAAGRPRGRRAAPGLGAAGMLLVLLLLPVIAVLALASRTPKFNPRYLMIVSPAYLLLLAGGIGSLVAWGHGRRAVQRKAGAAAGAALRGENVMLSGSAGQPAPQHAASEASPAPPPRRSRLAHSTFQAAGWLLAAFLVVTSVIGLHNWFANPAFTKAQWRELAAFVRANAAPEDAVLLVSGHAYPAWDYYAADLARTRLPEIDILDVDAVLGFDAGPLLAAALSAKRGAWLVEWQQEVVDPAGFIPFYLDRAGSELPAPAQFWHLTLRHWELAADAAFPSQPQPAHPDEANFDHKIALLGWDDQTNGQITVYWRCLNTLTEDYQVSLVLEDAAGRELGRWDGRPAGYDYPTTRWRPGQALFGRYPLPAAPVGGETYVTLALYTAADPSGLDLRDAADNPAGKRVRLGPVR